MKNIIFTLIILLGIFLISINKVYTQEITKEYPLFTFLQETFDSTIVYYSIVPRYYSHNYFIIGKKQQKVYLFTYKNPYEKVYELKYPDSLNLKLEREYLNYLHTIPDFNRFFLPQIFSKADSSITTSWRNLTDTELFSLQNDTTENSCIDKNGIRHETYDNATIYFITITHQKINHLSFYAPFFLNKFCPNDNIKKSISATEIIATLFNL